VVYACDAANRPTTVTGLAPTFATETVDAGYRMTLVEFRNGVESAYTDATTYKAGQRNELVSRLPSPAK